MEEVTRFLDIELSLFRWTNLNVLVCMKKIAICLTLLMVSSILSCGQNSSIDRLYQDKILSSINLGKELLNENEREQAISYFTEAIEIAEKRDHDYYAGLLVLNNDILEPTIGWFYSQDNLVRARNLVNLYEKLFDGTETALMDTGDISSSDYYRYMMYCYKNLSRICSDYKDYETSIIYSKKYILTAKSQGDINDDYLNWHKNLVWKQIAERRFDDAFQEAIDVYRESKDLGHTDGDALMMACVVYTSAKMSNEASSCENDAIQLFKLNEQWISFIAPLYESNGAATMDKILMDIDQKNSLNEELEIYQTSCTLIASYFTKVFLAFQIGGYDKAKSMLFELKSLISTSEYLFTWQKACVSFIEYLQTMQKHSAVYSFCKLVEPFFLDKSKAILEDYLTFYEYYIGACDRVGNIGKTIEILFNRLEDDGIKDYHSYWEIARIKGSIYISYFGDFEKGIESTLEALNLYTLPDSPKDADYISYAGLYGYVGEAFRRVGDYDSAIAYYKKDLNLCNEHNLKKQTLFPLFGLGCLYHSQKNYDEARKCFLLCADLKSQSTDVCQKSAPYSYLFDIERNSGNIEESRTYLTLTWNYMLEEYKSFKDYLTIYEQTSYWRQQGAIDYIGGLVAESAPSYNDIYYNMLLMSKGFLLKAETKEYQNVITSGNENLISLYNTIHTNKGVNAQLEDEYMTLYRSYNFSSEVQAPTWKGVQGALGKNDIAVEFFKYQLDDMFKNPQYGALLLKRDWDTPRFVHLCSENDLKQAMKAGTRMYHINDLLYKLLWEPLKKEVVGVKNIYFSPHELIHMINLSAIEDLKGKPLLESYNFHRLSSTFNLCERKVDDFNTSHVYGGLIYDSDDKTMLAEHRKYSSSFQHIEWVGDSKITRAGWTFLPNTELEMRDVARLLKTSNVTVSEYSGTSGTEESFKSLSGTHPGHIHLATHGFYLNFAPADSVSISDNPEKRLSSSVSALTRSGLILSNGGRAWKGDAIPHGIEDGILQADEIAGLDLSGTSLLVLSACQTALGDTSGDGVYGLQRAFKIAGVDTIIMSLWEVDDKATSEFMSLFYRALSDGFDKYKAFREAQKKLRKKYNNPYYWAAFIMLD